MKKMMSSYDSLSKEEIQLLEDFSSLDFEHDKDAQSKFNELANKILDACGRNKEFKIFLNNMCPQITEKLIGYQARRWLPDGFLRKFLMLCLFLVGGLNLLHGSLWSIFFLFLAAQFSPRVVIYQAYYLGRIVRFVKDVF